MTVSGYGRSNSSNGWVIMVFSIKIFIFICGDRHVAIPRHAPMDFEEFSYRLPGR